MFIPKPPCCETTEGCFVSCDSPNMAFLPGLLAHRQIKVRPNCSCTTTCPPTLETNAQLIEALVNLCVPPTTIIPTYSWAQLPRKGKHTKEAPLGGFPCVVISVSP